MLSLQAGGLAGLSVDMALFPLDTVKTRLQSQQGFFKAGGFRGIYAGLPSAAVGSVPTGLYICPCCTLFPLKLPGCMTIPWPMNHINKIIYEMGKSGF